MPTLRIQGPVPAEAPGPLRLGEAEIFIGRAPTCEVQIKDNQASRKHCRVYPQSESWFCEDLQSRNGTLLNGVELKAQSELRNGDVITIGDHAITFDTGKPKAPPPPALSGGGSDGAADPADVKNPSYEPFANEAAFGAPGTVYVLHFTGRAGEFAKVLEAPITTVGRGEDADIVIKEPLASRVHAQFEVKMTGLKLVDLESRNGSKINGQNTNQKSLERRDVIEIGETFIRVSARPPLTTTEMAAPDLDKILGRKGPDAAEGATIDESVGKGTVPANPARAPRLRFTEDGEEKNHTITTAEVIIGRSEKASVTIKEKLSSREHCKVVLNDDATYNLVDLGSRNGTKLNGRDVKGSIQILTGDVFSIGDTHISFDIPDDPAGGGGGGDAGVGGPIGGGGGGGVVVTGPTAPVARRSTVPPAVTAPGGIAGAQAEGPPGGEGAVVTTEPQVPAQPIAPRRRTSAAGASESSPMTTIMTALVIVVVLVVAAVILTNIDLGSGPSTTTNDDDNGRGTNNNARPLVNDSGGGGNRNNNGGSSNNVTDNTPINNAGGNGNNATPDAIAQLRASLEQLMFDERYGDAYQQCLDFIRDNQLDPKLTAAARTELEKVQTEAWDVYQRQYGSMDPASMTDQDKAQAMAEIRNSYSKIDRIIQDAARRFGN